MITILIYIIVLVLVLLYYKFNYLVYLCHNMYDICHKLICDSQNEIIKNLWIGDHYSYLDIDFLNKANIKLIINCTKNLKITHLDIVKYRIPVDDDRSEESNKKMLVYFKKYYPMVDTYLNKNLGVLVLCHSGCQRSATFICLYLMKKFNYTFLKAKNKIRSKRFIAMFPNVNFYNLLKDREKEIYAVGGLPPTTA